MVKVFINRIPILISEQVFINRIPILIAEQVFINYNWCFLLCIMSITIAEGNDDLLLRKKPGGTNLSKRGLFSKKGVQP